MRGIRRIPCGNVNCYLVQGEEGAGPVDTGYTGYVERRLDTCSGAGVRLLTDQQSQPLSAQGPAGRLLLSLSRHSFQTQAFLPFTPTVELREGDSLAPWGVDARVLELPGHTAGSIGLDVEGHSLIVGDAMMNLFRPGPSCLCSDPAAQRDSIARIRSLGPRSLYFGHGRPAHLPG